MAIFFIPGSLGVSGISLLHDHNVIDKRRMLMFKRTFFMIIKQESIVYKQQILSICFYCKLVACALVECSLPPVVEIVNGV